MTRHHRAATVLGTVVSIEILCRPATDDAAAGPEEALEQAFDWFFEVERVCSRFDRASELHRLSAEAGQPVPVSPLLREAVQFSLAVADASGGAFDPTLGITMEALGFNREHRTGAVVRTAVDSGAPSYRDVQVGPDTVTLMRPLLLDLGAVAKGLAIDLAVSELRPFEHFAIDAGGDLYLGGRNSADAPWSVGIRHPRRDDTVLARLRVSDTAVCTSGDYERQTADGAGHHIVDPYTQKPACGVVSATVVAPSAMTADALATAAFVLGPEKGLELLRAQGVAGLIVTSDLRRYRTPDFETLCDE